MISFWDIQKLSLFLVSKNLIYITFPKSEFKRASMQKARQQMAFQ